MRVAAFIGPSNSGKTTLICALVRHFVARGEHVAVIKHTHHALNEKRRGDTSLFVKAGAHPVILANDDQAVVFSNEARRIGFRDPRELLAHTEAAELVLVEGFKHFEGWPRFGVCSFEDAVKKCS